MRAFSAFEMALQEKAHKPDMLFRQTKTRGHSLNLSFAISSLPRKEYQAISANDLALPERAPYIYRSLEPLFR